MTERKATGQRELRRLEILRGLLAGELIPNPRLCETLAKHYDVRPETIRKDLHAVKENYIESMDEDLLRIFYDQFRKRLPEFEDKEFVRVVEFFKPKRSLVKAEVASTVQVDWRPTSSNDPLNKKVEDNEEPTEESP